MWVSLMCSVMKGKVSFDSLFTEGSFLTLNTSVKKMLLFQEGKIIEASLFSVSTSVKKNVAFSRGKITEGSFCDTEHFSEKNVAFSRGKNHWSFTFFSEQINELKISTSDFWEGRGRYLFSDSSRTHHWKLTCFSDCSQKQFSFFSNEKHHEQALIWNIHGLQSNEDKHSRFWMSKLFHDDE